ncbi:MAG: GAF domain-containing protein [Bacteroidetes bacterium]|nr:MAG: GAF domain-containing protein [Bacteroidota bacterium]TAG89845.1 MAG: GAF domain-containing protein [Bacteroidota bacterium]
MKKFFQLFRFSSISQKIIAGFIFIYVLFIVMGVISLLTLNQSTVQTNTIGKVINPSIDKLEEFRLKVTQAEAYTFSWVYEETNVRLQDKKALKKLHEDFPEFKDKLIALSKKWSSISLIRQLDSAITKFENIKKYQEEIIETLAETEDYMRTDKTQKAEKLLNTIILPETDALIANLTTLTNQKRQSRENKEDNLLTSFNNLSNLIIVFQVGLVFIGFMVNWWTRRQIVRPIKYINSVFVKLGLGEIPEDKHYKFNRDEIGEMATSADKLIMNLKNTSTFAEQIGKGEYETTYKPISDKDLLGNALLGMKDNLQKVADEESIRTWTNEGLVLFSDILKNNNELKTLSEKVISNLVKYLDGNQGALFIVEEEPKKESYLSLSACYAWDTDKSYLQQKVYQGDGLVGQTWQEQATICLTDIPEGYIRITSGLGESNPNCILIVPLKSNDKVYGVVELASFKIFEPFEISFVEKIAENIATSVANVRNSEKNQKLLDDSRQYAQQMQAQEEEMLQNMEALQVAKEFMETSQREAQEVNNLLQNSYMIIETDLKFAMITLNELTLKTFDFSNSELKGLGIDYLFIDIEKINNAKDSISKGESWKGSAILKGKGDKKINVNIAAASISQQGGEITKYLFILDEVHINKFS